jgi:hypothetical protein
VFCPLKANADVRALCAAGVEVWFDQSEVRGGDTWDALIRRQIKRCYSRQWAILRKAVVQQIGRREI